MPDQGHGDHDTFLKLIGIVFVALVFLGLGVSGTFNTALAGYNSIVSNPSIQHLQSKVTNAIKSETGTQIHNIENFTSQVRSSKI